MNNFKTKKEVISQSESTESPYKLFIASIKGSTISSGTSAQSFLKIKYCIEYQDCLN